ncbi:membrane metalloprotease [Constantimarinum furrinae]|uniref:Membrane metalloprotease n=1 Tax=Constantimarinum furrinae TaxID=2562285 RepID=A0A7G8PV74_9FLAO|nr:membrane metalloprotease [Constantimarinum furrinae]QNJ98240.1 hypothetical protein ALE3EI_1688 [Constantimarinum furrinae]
MRKAPLRFALLFLSFLLILSCKSDDGGPMEDPRAENLKALGTSAEDLLSDDEYTSIVVEIVYANGYRPQQLTIDSFEIFLNDRLNKPDGISIVETVIDAPQGKPFSIQEIREIEANNRTRYTVGDEIAVYVFFANGSSSNDTANSVTLGTAYQNTSIVIYEETIQNLNLGDFFLVEATTLRHEFGHLLGLVNIQGDDIHSDHEDPDNNKHCVVEECLMYFASTNPGTIPNPVKGDIPPLDELCLADLQAKGGK